jgi:hypothetical protein
VRVAASQETQGEASDLAVAPSLIEAAEQLTRKKFLNEIDFPSLLEHFQEVVTKHQMSRRKERASAILSKGVQDLNLPNN